ncbi:glutamate dehydrogenase [NAD(P)+] protein [Trichomonas vaginalis G3]|uniref:glutamate dehydrogenase [NAD(P)+] protein n=1 Tax=Trichomonas vaginalis (strain ATCC PRA-98 / G3) TaxID=412133 RepID=UPI0021E56997|nr:glutamate dehydrogenase [NAD(P)+] protein [Trichomonas vaginalis G3]KAI5531588.1 glutamate dehydrogenase [NAD(P)+] protein [Trichomonas vaginalis G3]
MHIQRTLLVRSEDFRTFPDLKGYEVHRWQAHSGLRKFPCEMVCLPCCSQNEILPEHCSNMVKNGVQGSSRMVLHSHSTNAEIELYMKEKQSTTAQARQPTPVCFCLSLPKCPETASASQYGLREVDKKLKEKFMHNILRSRPILPGSSMMYPLKGLPTCQASKRSLRCAMLATAAAKLANKIF